MLVPVRQLKTELKRLHVCRICSEDLHPVRRDVRGQLRSGSGGEDRHGPPAGGAAGGEGEFMKSDRFTSQL